MGRRERAREEARFARGEIGVDGRAVAEDSDGVEQEQAEAKEALFRSRTWLGREFLTWLLWRSEAARALLQVDGQGLEVLFLDRLVLRGIQGEVSELALKGKLAPYSVEARHAMGRGLLVQSARVRISLGERDFEATLDAECLDVRSAKLPQLLTEEEDDRRAERLDLSEQLSSLVDALVGAFLEVRVRPSWNKKVVPELQQWMRADGASGGMLPRLERARRVQATS